MQKFFETLFEGKGNIIDVRSEKEFSHGHIPGAINIPLLNDQHRHEVGIEYRQKGKEAAVKLGFELAGSSFGSFINKADQIVASKEVTMYCWRGGMRSKIMSWIFGMAGYQVNIIPGGYKTFRNWVLETFQQEKNLRVIGGKTGSGKTEILYHLKAAGQQIIDLEKLASHKGSSFGSLGQNPQPTYEHFENMLAIEWNKLNGDNITWVENESRVIGKIKIPDPIFSQMQKAPLIDIVIPSEIRINRLLEEYGKFHFKDLAACTEKLKKRLGDERTREALFALEEKRLEDWINNLLIYYDKTYGFGNADRIQSGIITINMNCNESFENFASRIICLVNSVNATA